MAREDLQLVGAVFQTRSAAAAAAHALHDRGLAPAHAVAAVWSGERYVIESPAKRKLRHSLGMGAVIGAAVGFLVAGAAAALLWPSMAIWAAFLVVGVIGAIAGLIIGGYVGLNSQRRLLWDQRDWSHVTLDRGQVLLVVGASKPADTSTILAHHGGKVVEPVHPQ